MADTAFSQQVQAFGGGVAPYNPFAEPNKNILPGSQQSYNFSGNVPEVGPALPGITPPEPAPTYNPFAYAAKGVDIGARETTKNFLSAIRASAVEAGAKTLAAKVQSAEDSISGYIQQQTQGDLGLDFSENPLSATAFNVGAGAPLLAGAVAAGAITRNPVPAALLFAYPAYGSAYDRARQNGLDHKESDNIGMLSLLINTGAMAIPMGRMAKMFETGTFGYGAKQAAASVAKDTLGMASEMGAIGAGLSLADQSLSKQGYGQAYDAQAVGEAALASFVTGGLMGAVSGGIAQASKARTVDTKVKAFLKDNPNAKPEEVAVVQQHQADIYDALMDASAGDPKKLEKLLTKYKDSVGMPMTFVELGGLKDSKIDVDFMMSGSVDERESAKRVVDKLLQKDDKGNFVDAQGEKVKSPPDVYVHTLERKAIESARGIDSDVIGTVKKFKEELDRMNNLYVQGASGEKVFSPQTEVYSPRYGWNSLEKTASMLKNPNDKAGGSTLPHEVTYYSHGLVTDSGKLMENSVALARIRGLFEREWAKDFHTALKTDPDGLLSDTFRVEDDGTVVVDSSGVRPVAEDMTGWKTAIDGRNLSEVNRTIKSSKYGALIEALSGFLKANGDPQVLVHTDQNVFGRTGVRGNYDSETNVINLGFSAMSKPFTIKEAAGVLLHESVHAATVKVMENFLKRGGEGNTPEMNARAKEVVDLYHETMRRTLEKTPDAIKILQKIRDGLELTQREKDSYYGFKDPHEFMAEGLSNPRFQEHLNNILIDESTSVLTKLKQIVTRIIQSIADAAGITINDKSALKKLVESTVGMMNGKTGESVERVVKEDIAPRDVPQESVEQFMSQGDAIQAQEQTEAMAQHDTAQQIEADKALLNKAIANVDPKYKLTPEDLQRKKILRTNINQQLFDAENPQKDLRWGSRLLESKDPVLSEAAERAAAEEAIDIIMENTDDVDVYDGVSNGLFEKPKANEEAMAINASKQAVSGSVLSNISTAYGDMQNMVLSLYRQSKHVLQKLPEGKRVGWAYGDKKKAGYVDVKAIADKIPALKWFNSILRTSVDAIDLQSVKGSSLDAAIYRSRVNNAEKKLEQYRLMKERGEKVQDWEIKKFEAERKRWQDKLDEVGPRATDEEVAQAHMIFDSFRSEVESQLLSIGVPAKFLYTIGLDRLTNREEFMGIIKKIAEQKQESLSVRAKEVKTFEQSVIQKSELKQPVTVRVDGQIPVDTLEAVVEPGIYILKKDENGEYVMENETHKHVLDLYQMSQIAREAAFILPTDQDLRIRTNDFFDPSPKFDEAIPEEPRLAGQEPVRYPVRNIFDYLSRWQNPASRANASAELFGIKGRVKQSGTIYDYMGASLMEHKQRNEFLKALAEDSLRPVAAVLNNISKEIEQRMDPQQKMSLRSAQLKVYDELARLLSFSAEETTSKYLPDGTATRFTTDTGLARDFNGDLYSAQNFTKDYKHFADMFGIKYDENSLMTTRPRRAFTTLAEQIDPRLPGLNVYIYGSIIKPMLEEGIRVGLFSSFDVSAAIMRGYTRRVWFDKLKDVSASSFNSTAGGSSRPTKRKSDEMNMSDWEYKTGVMSDLGINDDYIAGTRDYVMDYGGLIEQHKYIQWLKDCKTPEAEKFTDLILEHIKNKKKEGLRANVPDREELLKVVRQFSLVEYMDSEPLNKIYDMTAIKGDEGSGLIPPSTLTAIGYQKTHEYPGFAKFSGLGFEPPFVVEHVNDLIKTIFEARLGAISPRTIACDGRMGSIP